MGLQSFRDSGPYSWTIPPRSHVPNCDALYGNRTSALIQSASLCDISIQRVIIRYVWSWRNCLRIWPLVQYRAKLSTKMDIFSCTHQHVPKQSFYMLEVRKCQKKHQAMWSKLWLTKGMCSAMTPGSDSWLSRFYNLLSSSRLIIEFVKAAMALGWRRYT